MKRLYSDSLKFARHDEACRFGTFAFFVIWNCFIVFGVVSSHSSPERLLIAAALGLGALRGTKIRCLTGTERDRLLIT